MIAGMSSGFTGALKTSIILSTSLVHAALVRAGWYKIILGEWQSRQFLFTASTPGPGGKSEPPKGSSMLSDFNSRGGVSGSAADPGAGGARSPNPKRLGRIIRDMKPDMKRGMKPDMNRGMA